MIIYALLLGGFAMGLTALSEYSGPRGYLRNFVTCYAVLVGFIVAGWLMGNMIRTGLCAGYLVEACR